MNSPIGQLSAVAPMLQGSSNKQGTICEINRFVATLASAAYSEENSRSYWTSTSVLRAIFCKSHPTCDSRVFRISSYFNQLKIKVILEYGPDFSFIRHFIEFLGDRETTVVFQDMQSVSTSYILKTPSVS